MGEGDRDGKPALSAPVAAPPLIRTGLIHYQFEAVHPFIDGNGRIGRLLISLLLVNWKLLPLPLLYLSAYFEKQRQEYYDRLLAVSQSGAWREWLIFYLRGVAEQGRDAISRAKMLQDLQAEWRGRLMKARSSALLLRLVDMLFESPFLTIPRAKEVLKTTYPSAQLNIQKLVKAGILQQLKTSYGKLFVARDVLKIIDNAEKI